MLILITSSDGGNVVIYRRPIRAVLALTESDTVAWQGSIGKFGPEEWNENGVKLLEFLAFNSLVVTNTLFQHKPYQKWTWFNLAESSRLMHVLDYIVVNSHFRSSLLDTTYLQTDHQLVVSKVRMKLKAKRRCSH